MRSLLERIELALTGRGADATGICVAFSGGRDSTVLLHAVRALGLRLPLRAVHVDHGLHPDSAQWAAHCRELCRSWQVSAECLRLEVSLATAGGGLEAAARAARYAALRGCLRPGEFLLTAHHLEDQFETVLLRLMRGGGPAGVAGIPAFSRFAPGFLVRPLLDAGGEEIAAYADQHGLRWLQDPSNVDTSLDRNYLRHRVVPALRARWPAAAEAAGRAARLAGEAAELLDYLAATDAIGVVDDRQLDLDALQRLAEPRQRNLLRGFLRSHDVGPPGEAALREGLAQLLRARDDASPRLSWSAGELRRYRRRLYLLRSHPDAVPVPADRSWNGCDPLDLGPLAGTLQMQQRQSAGRLAGLPPLTVRFRRGGERLQRRGQHVSLKKLFQAGGVVPWMRPHVPLVYGGGELLSVGAIWDADDWSTYARETGRRLCWSPRERIH